MKNTASDGTGMSRLESSFSFKPKNRRKSDNHLREDDRSIEPGNLPRVSKLMALAIRFDGLVHRGEVRDYADLARLGYVTRARITQIMNLLNLAPDIQEALLDLPRIETGRAPIILAQLQPIASTHDWRKQRRMWQELVAT